MRFPRDVHGRDLADHLIRRWDFEELRQRGSHIVLGTELPTPYTVAVPAHKPLRLGTFKAIVAAIAQKKAVKPEDILNGL